MCIKKAATHRAAAFLKLKPGYVLLSQEGEPEKAKHGFAPANALAEFGEGRTLSEAKGPT